MKEKKKKKDGLGDVNKVTITDPKAKKRNDPATEDNYQAPDAFPSRQKTMDNKNGRRNSYRQLPPDAGFSYGSNKEENSNKNSGVGVKNMKDNKEKKTKAELENFDEATAKTKASCAQENIKIDITKKDEQGGKEQEKRINDIDKGKEVIKENVPKTVTASNEAEEPTEIPVQEEAETTAKVQQEAEKMNLPKKGEQANAEQEKRINDIDKGKEVIKENVPKKVIASDEEVYEIDEENLANLIAELNEEDDDDDELTASELENPSVQEEVTASNDEDDELTASNDEDEDEDKKVKKFEKGKNKEEKPGNSTKRKNVSEDGQTDDGDTEDGDTEACNAKAKVKASVEVNYLEPIFPEELLHERITASDITVTSHDVTEENPHHVVLVQGIPVASIELKDQENINEISAFFTSDDYTKALKESCENIGTLETLQRVSARFFANSMSESELGEKVRQEVITELNASYTTKLSKMGEKYTDALRISIAGFNKNIFPEDNSLKDSLSQVLFAHGIETPEIIVEAFFKEHGDTMLDGVITKASSIMGKPEEAVNELRRLTASSDYQPIGSAGAIPESDDIKARLTAGNVNIDTTKQYANGSNDRKLTFKARLN